VLNQSLASSPSVDGAAVAIDEDAFYEAVASRDRRFEGRFVVAVRTTRIYCRPGCPAPIPKRVNVRFYPCAAAAEQAGFRACMRCRPDRSPTCPSVLGTSTTVARALRLIGEGALDADGDVESLATRLGIGARHLRRLFDEHLGTSPVRIAQTRRVHLARKLIDETRLPMAQIALGTGFASVRRFNDAIRATFHKSPRDLRSERTNARTAIGQQFGPVAKDTDVTVLRVPFIEPFDWKAALAFLGARAIAGLEEVGPDSYHRAIAPGVWIEVTRSPSDPTLRVTVHGRVGDLGPPELLAIVRRTARLFDADAQPMAITSHLARDPLLGPIVRERPGLRVPGAWDRFELAVRAVLGQQVTVKHASTMAGRLASTFGTPIEPMGNGTLARLFPDAATLARADLSTMGLTRARTATLKALARAVSDGSVPLDVPGVTAEAIRESLLAIPGIGEWTASYVAMRALGDPDAFPLGDIGLHRAHERLATGKASGKKDGLGAAAEPWRPWRAYAAIHLWAADSARAAEKVA
jgi:AraC family transcriptional regulator, regulatory protein of adaptative response / DNA-3-methyladenine glycosylase II